VLLVDARGPNSTGCWLASDLLLEVAIILFVAYADTGLLPLDLLLSGTGASKVSMLRTGACAMGVVLVVGDAGAAGTGSSSISSILRTGERGVYGEEDRIRSGELACGLFSSRAKTSCRSISRAASMLIGR
jgi:hypothetical protein